MPTSELQVSSRKSLEHPTKRLNVEMSEEEYFALKRFALEQRKTVSEIVREAIHAQMNVSGKSSDEQH